MRHFLLWPAILLTTTLPAQSRVIDLTGEPATQLAEPFSAITGVVEVAPGRVVIADMIEQRVALADVSAGSVTPIGRQGGGPGEWQFPMAVLDGPGSQAMLVDPALSALHLIDASGTIVARRPFPGGDSTTGGLRLTIPRESDAAGRVFFTGLSFTPGGGERPDSIPIIRADLMTGQTDTLARMANETAVVTSSSGRNRRVAMRVGAGPLAARTLWTALPTGGIAIVHPEPYRVDVVDASGRVTIGTPVPYTPIKVTAAERDAYREASSNRSSFAIRTGSGGTSISTAPPPRDVPPIPDDEFPDVLPPFEAAGAIQVSPSADIWVPRSRPASDPTPAYDIFSARGQLIGAARLRPHSSVVGFGQGVVYVARQDPRDDLRYLETYRLP